MPIEASVERFAGLPLLTPRMVIEALPRAPGEVKPAMFGTVLSRSLALCTPRRSTSVALRVEIEIGTDCTFSSRFCAVTTISSMPRLVMSCWAMVPSASSRALAPTMPAKRAFLRWFR